MARREPKEWNVEPEPFQERFLFSRARFPAFVAGWGTGKTMMAILKGMQLSIEYPGNLGLIVRKNFTDLRDSTIKDFTDYTGIKVPTNKEVRLANGSVILFRHMDELAGIIQNVNLGWFFIEQAEEFENETEFEKLGGRLRRKGCFRQGFIIANTNGHNWIWRNWKRGIDNMCRIPFDHDSGIEGLKYTMLGDLIEANSYDNAHNLPEDTIADWKLKEQRSPSLYRRYILNSWDEADLADRIIPYNSILSAVNRDLHRRDTFKKVISCDAGEMGDDKTVIYGWDGPQVIRERILEHKDGLKVAAEIQLMHRDIGSVLIGVDETAWGVGVTQPLIDWGFGDVLLPIRAGRLAEDETRFARLKDQMWWYAREQFLNDYVVLPEDDDLIEELAAMTYAFDSKRRVVVARKKDIRKVLGRSPDKADAFVIGLWTHRLAPDSYIPSGPRQKQEVHDYNPFEVGLGV
jgi:hypothetical protein